MHCIDKAKKGKDTGLQLFHEVTVLLLKVNQQGKVLKRALAPFEKVWSYCDHVVMFQCNDSTFSKTATVMFQAEMNFSCRLLYSLS